MYRNVWVLTLLAAAVLASPTVYAEQDVLETGTASKDELIKGKISFHNSFPLEVSTQLLHWRGSGAAIDNFYEWDFIDPGENSTKKSLEFSKLRKDWDRWQIGFRYQEPNWTLWTHEFYWSPGIEDKDIHFDITRDGVESFFPGRYDFERFEVQGKEWPTEGEGLNSYLWLTVQNDLPSLASIEVGLETRASRWIQGQTYIEKARSNSESPLPFFFEANSTKDYVELLTIKVGRTGRLPLIATDRRCELSQRDAGSYRTLSVNATGWWFGYDTDKLHVICDGKWSFRRSSEVESDEEL